MQGVGVLTDLIQAKNHCQLGRFTVTDFEEDNWHLLPAARNTLAFIYGNRIAPVTASIMDTYNLITVRVDPLVNAILV